MTNAQRRAALANEMEKALDAAHHAGIPSGRIKTSEWYQARKTELARLDAAE